MAPCLAPVCDEGVESAAFDAVCEVRDGGADDFVAAAYCEGLGGYLDKFAFVSDFRLRSSKIERISE